MRADLDREEGRLILDFDDVERVASFIEGARSEDGFLATLPEEPRRGRELRVSVTAPDGFDFGFRAAVLHVFGASGDGVTTALQMRDWGPAKQAELRRKLGSAREGSDGGGESMGESLGVSPMLRIQKMTPPEKARLARRANRTERQILLRESQPQVMLALLNNPHLDADDVTQMIKSPYTPGGVLKRVAGDRRWVRSSQVRQALVRNPQTPPPLAIRLLNGLPTSTLQALARSGEVREDLKKAALKLYLKRMGK